MERCNDMTDATDDMDDRVFVQDTIKQWDKLDAARNKRQREIKSRLEQMQAHLDEGGIFGRDVRRELLGYIDELRELG